LAEANTLGDTKRLQKLSGAFSHYDGLALILVGAAIILVSLMRFIRTSRLILNPAVDGFGSSHRSRFQP